MHAYDRTQAHGVGTRAAGGAHISQGVTNISSQARQSPEHPINYLYAKLACILSL
jgi:hypothetical protein